MKCIAFKQPKTSRPFITWGVFDGVHRGHQKIINELIRQSRRHKNPSIVLTFQIHPDKVLNKSHPLDITSLRHRVRVFKHLGVDAVLVYPFTNHFSRITPENFIKNLLIKQLKIKGIVVGPDTKFGRNRTGTISLLRRLCKKYHLSLITVPPLKYRGRIISSTRIRKSIQAGKLNQASAMLGRTVSILGTVIKGWGRGKKLGFPTANLKPTHELTPPHGVYASQVQLKGRTYHALTNIGQRPTFNHSTQTEPTVETYILGLKNIRKINLYGQELEVQLFFKLRHERKFNSANELIRQIKRDEICLRKRIQNAKK